ncbi:DUF6732 family protein [Labrenzia sp. CE80]|uniref:DUF6732 family protein n=1 Tax=Labrenzia sp. CE80 TaxID=1788986 RepID=UPI0025700D0D|nr:DUF6732 family protein [Labrenzia sp. CE80]
MTMTSIRRLAAVALGTTIAGAPTLALAHVGHLGELAGHSHWVGVAALAGAALVAGVAALKGRRKSEDSADQQPQPDSDGEAEAAQ